MTPPAPTPRAPYIEDIHAQPDDLRALLDAGSPPLPSRVLERVRSAERIVLTGMGASLHALYPTYLRLLAAGLPVWLVETAELLGAAGALVTPRSALWITSQSGATAEAVALLDGAIRRPAAVIALTNYPASPLAAAADATVALRCGDERTVSTRSYTNTLAAAAMLEAAIAGDAPDPALRVAPEAIASYLDGWEQRLDAIDAAVPAGSSLFALGRRASLAAAQTGALIVKEAAAHPIEALSAPQFRHGPLEMAGPGLAALLLAGDPAARPLNERLRDELRAFGAAAIWLDPMPGAEPPAAELLRPFVEILPFQALSVVLARRDGREPGRFDKIEKVTTTL